LPLIVVHESVHAQIQLANRLGLPQLLIVSLIEGAADYVTNLVAGRTINDYKADWAGARRDELFRQFAQDLITTPNTTDKWLYNYNSVTGDQPADLAYWIVEEICRDYYGRARDKQAAINNIVTMLDPEAIVRGSTYAWLLPAK
jgi:hypothetical protein